MSNFYDMQEDVDKKLHGFAQRCFAKHGNHLKYLGTAAVARDLLAMADHLSPGKPVNLWLFSYATGESVRLLQSYVQNFIKVSCSDCGALRQQ